MLALNKIYVFISQRRETFINYIYVTLHKFQFTAIRKDSLLGTTVLEK
jgi:hypothetical protein